MSSAIARSDGPADNLPAQVRPVPPVRIELSADGRAELSAGLEKLNSAIDGLRNRNDAPIAALLPDVEIFALAHRELFSAAAAGPITKFIRQQHPT